MENDSGFPDLKIFDRSISDTAYQTIETRTEYPVHAQAAFAKLLDDRGVISTRERLEKQELILVVYENPDEMDLEIEDRLMDSTTLVAATASFYHSKPDDVALVGGVFVSEGFRQNGIGTRMKKQLLNHMRQRDIETVYTFISSIGGYKLAKKTGFSSEKELFSDVGEIRVKQLE